VLHGRFQALVPQGFLRLAQIALGEFRAHKAPKIVRLDVRQATLQPLSVSSAWRVVRKYALQCGLPHVKPHDFRRFVGTELAKRDLRQAQKALGHQRLETTVQHYVLDELQPGLTEDLF